MWRFLCAALLFGGVGPICQAAQSAEQLDLTPLPTTLSAAPSASGEPPEARQAAVSEPKKTLPEDFFTGLTAHPRPNLEARARLSVERYEKLGRKKPYLKCRLQDGKVVIGMLIYSLDGKFILRTGLFAEETINYSDLIADPEPVQAHGQRFVRGTQIAGVVVLVIAAAPIFMPIYALQCLGGNCPD